MFLVEYIAAPPTIGLAAAALAEITNASAAPSLIEFMMKLPLIATRAAAREVTELVDGRMQRDRFVSLLRSASNGDNPILKTYAHSRLLNGTEATKRCALQ
jgi:hypothetical protein